MRSTLFFTLTCISFSTFSFAVQELDRFPNIKKRLEQGDSISWHDLGEVAERFEKDNREAGDNFAYIDKLKRLLLEITQLRANWGATFNGNITAAIEEDDVDSILRLLYINQHIAHDELARLAEEGRITREDGPLHRAIERRRTSLIRLLLLLGADPNVRGARGRTPLIVAMQEDPDLILRLLPYGALVGFTDDQGRGPLHYMHTIRARGRLVMILETLFENGITPSAINAPDTEGKTPLMLAAVHGLLEIARRYLDEGATVDATDRTGRTALSHVVEWGHVELADLLLLRGADRYLADNAGLTPVDYSEFAIPNGARNQELRTRVREAIAERLSQGGGDDDGPQSSRPPTPKGATRQRSQSAGKYLIRRISQLFSPREMQALTQDTPGAESGSLSSRSDGHTTTLQKDSKAKERKSQRKARKAETGFDLDLSKINRRDFDPPSPPSCTF